MSSETTCLCELLQLNTRLFKRCIDGLSDEMAGKRPNEQTCSAAYLAAHLVDSRHCLARMLGVDGENLLHDVRQTVTTVVELQNEPPLAEITRAWRQVTDALTTRLCSLTETELKAASPEKFPVEDSTVLGSIIFLLHHESYHIGQLALTRKYHGAGAVRYGHRAMLTEV